MTGYFFWNEGAVKQNAAIADVAFAVLSAIALLFAQGYDATCCKH